MILCQRSQPQRQLREIGCHPVLVQPVETALRNQTLCVERFVLVGRDARDFIMQMPRFGERVAELAACFYEKRCRPHC